MMRTLKDDYCPVCRQETIYAIYARLPGLVNAITPSPETTIRALGEGTPARFEIDANEPAHGLVYEWSVDGEVVEANDPDFDLRCSGVNGELWLRVYDPTDWVRVDPYGLTWQDLGPWKVRSSKCDCSCSAAGPEGSWSLLLLILPLLRARGRR
jgi:hypothetical protein